MQTATIKRGSKTARVTQTALDRYKVVVAIVSDINPSGDVMAAGNFKTATGALNFANKELA